MATAASSPPRSATAPPSEADPDASPPSPAPEIESKPPAPAPASAVVNPRRPPPPCWSPDETVALIDIYREKWHSLGRAALKLNHWQEVADAVASRCPVSNPPKTSTQCRHKIEKLRKRYKAELRRAESLPVGRFTSSWVHFKQMDAVNRTNSLSEAEDESENDDMDLDFYEPSQKRKKVLSGGRSFYPNGIGAETLARSKNEGRFRIKIPSAGREKFDPSNYANPGEKRQRQSTDPLQEVVSAVRVCREGFERMERMKIDMAKEIGAMQREMEMKRTEMILESQQFIVETLAKVLADQKKKKMKKTKMNNNNSNNNNIDHDKNKSKIEEAPERITTPEAES